MARLNENSLGIVLVVDDHRRMIGTLTDGDIRRALLGGAALDDPALPAIQRKFVSVVPGTSRAAVLDLMKAMALSQIPILNADGQLVGMHLMRGLLSGGVRPNWAVILAGGLGTRLGPLTAKVPKPMLKVAGRPILERLVLHLVGCGIREIFISVNYLAHVIEEHFGDGSRHGCRIRYLREEEPLGTGGPLSILPEVPEAPVIVMNGDLVTEANLESMLEFHVQGGFAATLSVRLYIHQVPFGCVSVRDGRVVRLEEKPSLTQMINAGIYVVSPHLLPRIPRKYFPITRIFEECLEKGERVGAFPLDHEWIDVGMTEQLRQAREGTP
jgi:dTDP-glucose pyrophosphorylase